MRRKLRNEELHNL